MNNIRTTFGALFTQEFAAGPWVALAGGLVLAFYRRDR